MSYICPAPDKSTTSEAELLTEINTLANSGAGEFLRKSSGVLINEAIAAGSGTVTSVSITAANGISGVVATETTTPAITLSLENIVPTTVNGLTLASQLVGFTIAGGTTSKTLTVPLDASVSGTNTGDNAANSSTMYIGTTQVALNRASAALTLAGLTLTTPDIGVATATSVNKVAFTAPANGATITITDGKTLTVQDNVTITGALGTGAYATIADYAAVGQTFYIGTTQVAINRASAILALAGIRSTPKIYSTDSIAGTPGVLTPEISTYDYYEITAQAAALDIANMSTSTPVGGEKMIIAITSDATARALTYGTSYVAKGGVALPSTTVASKTTTLGFVYNAGLTKWNLLAVGQEA